MRRTAGDGGSMRQRSSQRVSRGVRGRPPGSRDMHGKARPVDRALDRDTRLAIARRVRDARLERDVSPYELGAATGLDASCIYKIERGEVRVLAQTLCRIAAALGMCPSELMP